MNNKIQKILNSKNIDLEKISTAICKQYVNAEPYPHIVLDDFFENSFCLILVAEISCISLGNTISSILYPTSLP